ncbi:signal peptide peptidase SppA [Neiella marina]|uniref:Signal peptide peptidase SppA n=1 Tax=Neiella holothuriorum TaxID=2870530 RepID=A0ABS7EEM2_9GAMM|nr:signal peptide peptidase SppA [Neiella holothuriorum]MBW8190685.1 signal peptide peptidase SppA [Neiella holothuriorum]
MTLIRRFFQLCWRTLNWVRKALINIVFLVIVIGFIVAISSQDKGPQFEEGALVLSLDGRIVEQTRAIDPMAQFFQEALGSKDEEPEILLADVVRVIESARHDKRITALVIDASQMRPSGLSKLREISTALEQFKKADKPVISIGDWYSQDQYYLASQADSVLMNPNGMLMLEGYGSYQLFFKSMLEKLKINTHVFRVGTFKSAVEPFIRDDMSDEARLANQVWLNDLWQIYLSDVSTSRGLAKEELEQSIHNYAKLMEQHNGDTGQLALAMGLVDELTTRPQMRKFVGDLVGFDEEHKSFKQIHFSDYLDITKLDIQPPIAQDKVGIVVAKGTILNGNQPAGTIGGDSTARLLRQARLDDDVKAVVLRIDSPGGSAFASDIIREQIEELKKAGKPVVASMSSTAASGGYWIAAPADKIIASPATITGSIGIFGMLTTFENSLDHIGVHADGVGTTPLAGFSPARPLDETFERIIQQSIEHGYQQFLELVASNREMTVEQVDEVAQGRVWSGMRAKELGLVDELGDLNAAITAAAELAGLEKYDSSVVEKPLSERDKLLQAIFGQAQAMLPAHTAQSDGLSPLLKFAKQVLAHPALTAQWDDPGHTYALCLQCGS